MKRIGNLFEKVISLENLKLADEKARKGKLRSYGVQQHDKNRDANILALHESLKNGTFKTSKYHVFTIFEPKERQIYQLPYFPDRILHHAVMNILEPIWVSVFNGNTYSCIKNRGIHACAKDLKKALKKDKEGTKYCLKIDVRKFYPSINHEVLKSVVRRKIKDNRLLALLDEIIDSSANTDLPIQNFVTDIETGEMVATSLNGVPIGNYLSQYFANLFLAYFDHWIKEAKRVKYFGVMPMILLSLHLTSNHCTTFCTKSGLISASCN
jgi:retron-type reverse transcriptase